MGRIKTTSLQKRWNTHFSQRLGEIFQKHKVHHGLTLATLGEALGYEEPGRQMRVKRLLNGETECPPETIQELARFFYNASPRKGKPLASPDLLEAQLSASAGRQMPAFIDELPQKSLDSVLDIIANISWLAVLNSTQRVQGSRSKTYRWKLIVDELNHIIWGWLAISRLEEEIERLERKSDGDQTGDTPSGRDFLDSMWQEISKGLDQGPTPIQAAYARALWGRVQAWSGATGLSDEMARVALRELEGIVNQSDDARLLVSRARMILADNQRAKGLLNPALALYDTAINDLPVAMRLDSPQRIRLR